MRVNVNASPQILEIFLAPEDKPILEAQATAAICWTSYKVAELGEDIDKLDELAGPFAPGKICIIP